jgi:hypothetical protein
MKLKSLGSQLFRMTYNFCFHLCFMTSWYC